MKRTLQRAAWCALLAAMSAGAAEVEQTELIERTFRFNGAAPEVRIDNVNGHIEVEGHRGATAELTVRRLIRADSEEKVQKAREEERLEITEEDGVVDLYVNGPYRCKDGGINYRGRRHHGYESRFDFTLRVPTATKLRLKTINEAHITVLNTTGDFDLKVINGGLDMTDVGGSGRAYALNGKLEAKFRANPASKSYFGSLNGDVEVSFPANLSADVRVKTFNGEVYSDFPVTHLPRRAPRETMRKGRLIYRTDEFAALRIGNGGPEIEFDAFNGDIRILRTGADND